MSVKIIETNLHFKNTLRNRAVTKRIIVHHTASPDVSAKTIHQWHLNKSWSGLGYHYVIRANGDIERGRPERAIGAHAIPANGDGIGIVLTGNFEQDKPSQAQLDSLVALVLDIQARCGGNLQVLRHKDVDATACPGRNFPWQVFKQRLEDKQMQIPEWKLNIMRDAEKTGLIDPKAGHKPDDTATKWFVLAVGLNLIKALKGGR